MGRTKNGISLTNGVVGPNTYYVRKGQIIARIKENLPREGGYTAVQCKQQSKLSNIILLWRSFNKALFGCFENKKPGATDYSGYMAANLPEARVYLPKRQGRASIAVADNIFVSMGSLQPAIQVEESGEWWLSDIAVKGYTPNPQEPISRLIDRIASDDNGAYRYGDELLFVRMRQRVDLNTREPQVDTTVHRLPLTRWLAWPTEAFWKQQRGDDGFQVVDGRLAARRRERELVAWIHLRREGPDTVRATTQRLVGHNPLVTKYMSAEAIQEAVATYKPGKAKYLAPEQVKAPQVSIMVSCNDVRLGAVQGGGEYAPGAVVTLRAVPAQGARFVIWDDGEQSPERVFPALSNAAFKAIFVPQVQ